MPRSAASDLPSRGAGNYRAGTTASINQSAILVRVLATAIGPGITGLLIDAGVPFSLQLGVMEAYSLSAAVVMWLMARRLSAERGCCELPA